VSELRSYGQQFKNPIAREGWNHTVGLLQTFTNLEQQGQGQGNTSADRSREMR